MKLSMANVMVWLNIRRKYVIGIAIGFIILLALLSMDSTVTDPAVRSPNVAGLATAENLYYWRHQKVKAVNEEYWPRSNGEKYLAWKSWHAGFNNERISLELAFVFATLLNRTLVLPPGYRHYNLKEFMYEKFFEFEDMNKAIPVISFDTFAEKEGISADYGNIKDKAAILRWPDFPNAQSIFVYPSIPDQEKEPEEYAKLVKFARKRRLGLMRSPETEPAMVKEKIIYFPDHQLFTHFYAYIYIRDPHLDRYVKRLIRDHVHIRADIFDTAALIVNQLPKDFYSIHFRRGDFQYPNQRQLTGGTIFDNVKGLIPAGSTIYLATDENDMSKLKADFLNFFKDTYKIVMYGDYEHLVQKYLQPNWVGVIEQIICSRGKVFIGTKLSTYSGYITRIRGYYTDIDNKEIYFTDTKYPEGYNDPKLFSKEWPRWQDFWLDHGLWAREFQEAWEGIDVL